MNEHEEAVTEDAEEAAEEVAEEGTEEVAPVEDVAANEWTPEELTELGEEPAPEVEPEPTEGEKMTTVHVTFTEEGRSKMVDEVYERLTTQTAPEPAPEVEVEPETAIDLESEEFAEFREAFADNTEQILTTPNPLMQQVEIEIAARKQALHDRIRHDYAAHGPKTPEVTELFNNIAAQFEQLAHATIDQCPDGRDLSLALTHLEDAKRYAIAAVAKNQ